MHHHSLVGVKPQEESPHQLVNVTGRRWDVIAHKNLGPSEHTGFRGVRVTNYPTMDFEDVCKKEKEQLT